MRPHGRLDEEARERALGYVLERLEPDEQNAFEAHLVACEACRAEVALLVPVGAALEREARARAPARAEVLWRRVRAATLDAPPAALQPWRRWDPANGFVPSGSAWEPSGVPGVETRRLHVSAAGERVTMLVRMAPGASYPGHRHGGPESCFVVSGDLRVGDELHMRAGDFQHVEEGSRHPVQTTDGGCLLLITCSTADELLD